MIQMVKDAKEMGTFGSSDLNKWQKERLMQTVISKDTFRQVPNDKYFQVSHSSQLILF